MGAGIPSDDGDGIRPIGPIDDAATAATEDQLFNLVVADVGGCSRGGIDGTGVVFRPRRDSHRGPRVYLQHISRSADGIAAQDRVVETAGGEQTERDLVGA